MSEDKSYCVRCQENEVNWEDMLCKECLKFEKLTKKRCFNCEEKASENWEKCDYHDIVIGVCDKEECRRKAINIRCSCDLS